MSDRTTAACKCEWCGTVFQDSTDLGEAPDPREPEKPLGIRVCRSCASEWIRAWIGQEN